MATTRNGCWTWIWSTRHCGLGQEVACWFQCWKNSTRFNWLSNNTDAIDAKMDGSILDKKSSFKKLWLSFSSKLDRVSYIISITKTASKKKTMLHQLQKQISRTVGPSLAATYSQTCPGKQCITNILHPDWSRNLCWPL